jgi:hypothetical protein
LIGERALRAEAGNGEVDNIRVGFYDARVVELELVDLADAIVLQDYVTFGGKPLHDRHALPGLEIDGERALGAVDNDRMRRVIGGSSSLRRSARP